MTNKIYIPDTKAMMDFGGKIADQFPQGGIVLLNGDLGAGKTTLVRGLLRHLGYEGIVKSPTYTLVEPYQLVNTPKYTPPLLHDVSPQEQQRTIYHFDLYRLADPEELEYIGGRDYWNSNALCLIEWPEKAAGYLPEADLEITLQYQGDARKIEISKGNISL
ncbi:MAG: tRNA (adenosine(37)-N6)-threonylcarbamoyltransferase complex ATPase subunit type 1 TsaE [Cocleimonas sp.]|nr:tRNA (adenosine(37)-N6)-threonylcarbamoyltransferase complex ATPase subunit type 1 TsaE [Cocleimonas sp.]